MEPPPGITLLPSQALLIRRSLYGPKQAARDWHDNCVGELAKLRFEQMPSDPYLLRHPKRGIVLLLYVNEVGLAARSLDEVKWFQRSVRKDIEN